MIGCAIGGDVLAERLVAEAPSGSAMTPAFSFGSHLYRVAFSLEAQDTLRCKLGANFHQPETISDALSSLFAREWGLSYDFSLFGSVDAQREYSLPWDSFEELLGSSGFTVALDAPFPALLEEYKTTSRYFHGEFLRASAADLNADEEELFSLYSGFVLERSHQSES